MVFSILNLAQNVKVIMVFSILNLGQTGNIYNGGMNCNSQNFMCAVSLYVSNDKCYLYLITVGERLLAVGCWLLYLLLCIAGANDNTASTITKLKPNEASQSASSPDILECGYYKPFWISWSDGERG